VRLNDAVIGVVLVLFALAVIGYARTFPAMPGQNYGPALFPTLIGIGLALAGAILIVGGVARRKTDPLAPLDESPYATPARPVHALMAAADRKRRLVANPPR
jgi:putative tricarboxylic transport membrane protein